jgi:sugar O-acyltransferase (sialic acid O-acetyltransferase NeuD family)
MAGRRGSLVLVGGGGHCLSCIEVIESAGRHRIIGIIDIHVGKGEILYGYPVLGGDEVLSNCIEAYGAGIVTVGQIAEPAVRHRLYDALSAAGAEIPVIASPRACISRRSEIGAGSVVFHAAIVNAGARIGVNAIINSAAIVEHGTEVGDHVHISTGAIVNGDCHIGSETFIGSGTVVLQGIHIASHVVIGAGSLVRRDVEHSGVYAGNPLRRLHDTGERI